MDGLSDEAAELYANVIEEIKVRIEFVQRALRIDIKDKMDWLAVSDFCCLQLRKTFEAIALGCLAVHGDLPGTKRIKDDTYRADKLLKSLEKLNPNFYPMPCRIRNGPGKHEVGVSTALAGEWLTKERLQKYYFQLDDFMHVGSLSRRPLRATAISPESIIRMVDYTRALLQNHVLNLTDPHYWLAVELNDPEDSPRIRLLRK